ncbi:MAG TPA: family 78 glycoside hydrolase catalytic domain [Puia sp.]|jgi:alpha-L-rhamnosidase
MRRYFIILFLLIFGQVSAQEVGKLSCEQRTNPEGIDVLRPRLSWQIIGEQSGVRQAGGDAGLKQTAWQVIVASSEEKLAKDMGDLWNSGKVGSDESVLIAYAGLPLKSRMACYWKVKVWTSAGMSGWSKPAYWSMGLLSVSDWKGKWIGYDQGFAWDSVSKFSRLSARYYRKTWDAGGSIRKAMLYIAGPGHYIVSVNGKAIGDQVLAQAPTDYTKSVTYNTYDVTEECSSGKNVMDVVLGNGRFFTMRPKYKPKKIKEFGFPKLLLQLEIIDNKGQRRVIVSDTSWRFTADGPIRSNNEYDGEEYDARKELGNWMKPQLVAAPGGRLVAQMDPPIKVMTTIKPVGIKEGRDGTWILDMGQNMAGWVQMKVRGSRGQQVVLRFAETLKKDGSLYTANLRDAKVTDKYTLKGGGEEVWHPVFVFHGFRYVEIIGYPGRPGPGDFEGQVVYDDLANVGEFHCSDTIVNQLFRNAWWGINSNYKGMPVDCPQRNERMPWLGDRATGSLGESYLFNNGTLYAKWLEDIEESQKQDGQLPDVAPAYWNYYSDNMTWPGVYILVADMLYNQYGDVRPIQLHYASMKKWLQYMSGKYEKDGIITKDKYGDWCVPPESPELIHSKDSTRNTDGQLIATAYYYHLLGLMRQFAGLLHVSADAAAFAAEEEKVRAAFNKKFFVEDHYSNNTVTANLLPLYFGMVQDAMKKEVFKHITDKIESNGGHISTGVIGTQWLMRGLTLYGRADLAYRIAGNTDYPSWGYMVKHGATTIWELWNGDSADPAMNSQNHIMLLGDLLTWMFQDLAGIAPAAPGFKRIRMKPVFPAGLNFAEASYGTPYGRVSSSWRKKDGGIIWDVVVPANVRAQVYLPDGKMREIGSGTYHFESKLKS